MQISPRCRLEKGETIVKDILFKCSVSLYNTLSESALFYLLGFEKLNRLKAYDNSSEPNSRIDDNHNVSVKP